jgi:uncharacterized protein YkwD
MALMAVVLLVLPAAAGARARAANAAAESKMLTAINKVRAKHGLAAFRASSSLMGSARRYSRWLMANDAFRHLSRIQASSRFFMLGEALAMHTGRSFSVRGTINQWMASPPHRALVLSSAMKWAGAGVTRGRFGASQSTIWVLHTGRIHPLGTSVTGSLP